jgi:Flp pilus assembly protein TadD
MLERASQLAPDDSSITDSLAWAYFRNGDAQRALPLLERAAMAAPANGEIAEHLGDAYWMVGRRYEARYSWRAAAIVADASDGARLAAKIATGLTGNNSGNSQHP